MRIDIVYQVDYIGVYRNEELVFYEENSNVGWQVAEFLSSLLDVDYLTVVIQRWTEESNEPLPDDLAEVDRELISWGSP